MKVCWQHANILRMRISNVVATEICLKANVLGKSNKRLLETFNVVVML